MGDAGDALSLLYRHRAHQGAGGHEQHLAKGAFFDLGQDMPAEDRGAAPAAGSARLHILFFPVKDHQPAVVMVGQRDAVFLAQQLFQAAGAHGPQVAGENTVVIRWVRSGILKKEARVSAAAGAMAAPILLISVTPRSTTLPKVKALI